MDGWAFVSGLRDRRGMWLPDSRYAALVSALIGFDAAQSGGLLGGFQELVELKYGHPSSNFWSALATQIEPSVEERGDDAKCERLFDLLEEFLAADHGLHGPRRIFHEWFAMAELNDVGVELLRFGSSPHRETVSIDDAAALLQADRRRVFALVHEGRLGSAHRVGAHVLLDREAVARYLDGT